MVLVLGVSLCRGYTLALKFESYIFFQRETPNGCRFRWVSFYAFTACANSAACFFIRSSSNWSICAISEDLNCSAFAMPTK